MMNEEDSFDDLVREKLNSREFKPSAERRAKAHLAIQARNAEKSSRYRIGFIFVFILVTAGILLGNHYFGISKKSQLPADGNQTKTASISKTNGDLQNQTENSSQTNLNPEKESPEKNQSNGSADPSVNYSVANTKSTEQKNATKTQIQNNVADAHSQNAVTDAEQKSGQHKKNVLQNVKSVSDVNTKNVTDNSHYKSSHQKGDDSVHKSPLSGSGHSDPKENRSNKWLSNTYSDSVKMKSFHTDNSDSAKMQSYVTDYSDSTKMQTYHTENKIDSAATNTVSKNAAPPNQGGSVNYFFLEGGMTFIPGFSPGFHSGRSLNPVLGAGFCFHIGEKMGMQIGLHYTFIGNASDSNLIYTNTSYGFGAQVEYTDVSLKRLHYASLPVSVLYHFNSTNAINAGVNFNYLFTTETHLHTYSATDNNIHSGSKFGYIQGVNRFDLQISAGYTRTFGAQWSAGISVYTGLMDIKRNSWYGVNKFERNKGLQLTVQYAF